MFKVFSIVHKNKKWLNHTSIIQLLQVLKCEKLILLNNIYNFQKNS